MAIGQFYMAIDKNLQAKGSRPDNTYRFVERVVMSEKPRSALMMYGFEDVELKVLQVEMKGYSEQNKKLTADLSAMQRELEETKTQLDCVKQFKRYYK